MHTHTHTQKKSREESEGEGSGVEIIENRPYTDGPNGSGQYTYKIFHIGRHLPSWFRSMAPKTALEVHEEAWNAYPYTKTKFSVPFVEKFSMEVETYFEPDAGTQVQTVVKVNPSTLCSVCDVTSGIGSRKGGRGGGGWVHRLGEDSMAASGLGSRRFLVGTGQTVSLLLRTNGFLFHF